MLRDRTYTGGRDQWFSNSSMDQIFRAKPCRMLNIWLCSSNNVLKAEQVQSDGPSLLFKLLFNLFLKRNFAKDMQIEFSVPIFHAGTCEEYF